MVTDLTDDDIVADDDIEFDRLAGLSVTDYERERERAAKRLGVRVSILDSEVEKRRPAFSNNDENSTLGLFDPEPWPEEVDGDDLLDQIRTAIQRHVVMPETQSTVVALWAVHAHAFECWRFTPRLAVVAPEKGCGKSTVLNALRCLVPRGLKTENLSTAAMFRVVDGYNPTLLIDEFDTFLPHNDDLRGALNAGHERGGMHIRCEGDNNEVRGFKTFAPAALAGIGRLPGTLADRSVYVTLKKRLGSEPLAELTEADEAYLRTLAGQAARWVGDNRAALENSRPKIPYGIINRVADNFRPLVAIANAAGGEWPDRLSAAIQAATKEDTEESVGVRLLRDLQNIFEQTGKDRITSDALPDLLKDIEDGGWAEFGKREVLITKTQIARILSRYGISSGPHRGWKPPKEIRRGFLLDDLNDAFDRYLPAQSVTALQPNVTNGSSDFQSVTPELPVTLQKTPKPSASNLCNAVTLHSGDTGQEAEDAPEREDNGSRDKHDAPARVPDDADEEERRAIEEIDGGLTEDGAHTGKTAQF